MENAALRAVDNSHAGPDSKLREFQGVPLDVVKDEPLKAGVLPVHPHPNPVQAENALRQRLSNFIDLPHVGGTIRAILCRPPGWRRDLRGVQHGAREHLECSGAYTERKLVDERRSCKHRVGRPLKLPGNPKAATGRLKANPWERRTSLKGCQVWQQ